MNLDDTHHFKELDSQGMLSEIDGLPDQLEKAWSIGQSADLPRMDGIRQVVVVGMGGSAIGGDLLAAYMAPHGKAQVSVWRGYDLPGFARGKDTLVIASSHSGNTEETLSGYERAKENGVQLMAVTTGGELAKRAKVDGVPLWTFDHPGQPRAAVGYSFGMLLAAAARLNLVDDPSGDVVGAADAMRAQQVDLTADVPAAKNPAKRIAGQLMDRWPIIVGAQILSPVARRWRTQIAEVSKALAQFEELPEMDHNMLAGVENPEARFGQTVLLFLRCPSLHPRVLKRIDITRELFMVEGFNTDIIDSPGDIPLAHQWTSLHFGDYVSFYLAMAYETDPSPVRAIEGLKERLKQG
jgi:glucose/mannose-6-phosphate isomerase